ncbi:MAG: DUF4097 family beta strand repeat-containing protein [Peptostreptococcaceae bacterium]
MKKKFNFLKMTLLSLTAICLSFSFAKALSNDNLKTVSQKSLSLVDINDININLDVDNVIILSTDEDKISIIEKCCETISNKDKLNINSSKNSINISRNSNLNLKELDESFKRDVLIYLPKSYKNNLNLNITHGDLTFDSDINLNNIKVTLNTGDITTKNSITSNSFIAQNQTGEIDINSLFANEFDLSLNTGNINISNLSGKGYITTTNGNINCDLYDLLGNLEIYSSNGDINVNVEKKGDFILNSSCDIGDIESDFSNENKSNTSSNLLNIGCGLGSIKINKNF